MRFVCTLCDNTVDIRLFPADGEEVSVIEVVCATRHGRPVKMEEVLIFSDEIEPS